MLAGLGGGWEGGGWLRRRSRAGGCAVQTGAGAGRPGHCLMGILIPVFLPPGAFSFCLLMTGFSLRVDVFYFKSFH